MIIGFKLNKSVFGAAYDVNMEKKKSKCMCKEKSKCMCGGKAKKYMEDDEEKGKAKFRAKVNKRIKKKLELGEADGWDDARRSANEDEIESYENKSGVKIVLDLEKGKPPVPGAKKKTYQVGETSQQTGKKKVAPGKWVDPKTGKVSSGEGDGKKPAGKDGKPEEKPSGNNERQQQQEERVHAILKKKLPEIAKQIGEGVVDMSTHETATAARRAEGITKQAEETGKQVESEKKKDEEKKGDEPGKGKQGTGKKKNKKKNKKTDDLKKKEELTGDEMKQLEGGSKKPAKKKKSKDVKKSKPVIGFDLMKDKVFVPAQGGRKSYFREDPRDKKAKEKIVDGYVYRQTGPDKWVKLGKADKVQKFSEKEAERKDTRKIKGEAHKTDKSAKIKEGAKVKVKSSSRNLGGAAGVVGKIKEVIGDAVRIVSESGDIFRVPVSDLAFARSDESGWENEADVVFKAKRSNVKYYKRIKTKGKYRYFYNKEDYDKARAKKSGKKVEKEKAKTEPNVIPMFVNKEYKDEFDKMNNVQKRYLWLKMKKEGMDHSGKSDKHELLVYRTNKHRTEIMKQYGEKLADKKVVLKEDKKKKTGYKTTDKTFVALTKEKAGKKDGRGKDTKKRKKRKEKTSVEEELAAAEKKKASREGYINERLSDVKNKGVDVLGAARHRFDTWSLEDLEKEGLAGKHFNKNHLFGAIEPDIESRKAAGDTDDKIGAAYAIRRLLKSTVSDDPERRTLYEGFHRLFEKADADNRNAKDFINEIAKGVGIGNSMGGMSFFFGDKEKIESDFRSRKAKKDLLGARLYNYLSTNEGWLDWDLRKLEDSNVNKDENTLKNYLAKYAPKEKVTGKAKELKKNDVVVISDEQVQKWVDNKIFGANTVEDKLTDKQQKQKAKLKKEVEAISKKAFDEYKAAHPRIKNDYKIWQRMQHPKEYYEKMRELRGIQNESRVGVGIKSNTVTIRRKKAGGKHFEVVVETTSGTKYRIDVPVDNITLKEKGEPEKRKNPTELEKGVSKYSRTGGKKVPDDVVKAQEMLIGKTKKSKDANGNTIFEIDTKRKKDNMRMRALQYGNAMNDEERKHHTIGMVGAMSDLADVMGLPVEDISMNGRLAVAFGARGKGTANAHYEPAQKIMNLTKDRGFGTVCHEYGHFFDNVVSNISLEKKMKGSGGYASEGNYKGNVGYAAKMPESKVLNSKELGTGDLITTSRGEILKAVKDEKGKLTFGLKNTKTGEFQPGFTIPERTFENGYITRHYGNDYNQTTEAAATLGAIGAILKEELQTQLKDYSDYWKRPREMFARAFEVYVSTKLAKEKRKNTYLVREPSHYDNVVYPQGETRKKVNKLFEKALKQMKGSDILEKAKAQIILDFEKSEKPKICFLIKSVGRGEADKKGVTEKDVDANELKMGIKEEMEHTSDKSKAKEIALDHLAEDPKYYTKLKKVMH